ncbi:MAG: hypothetical protein ASARMPRED_005917 [Alectoria sarmentosa]|nr:MAG: hypothetical protein ASARMPRED_005917 [Alectoria sarmentosa]
MIVAPENPKQPETSGPPTVSIPFRADLKNGRDIQPPESNLEDSQINGSNHHGRHENIDPHYDEYTTLLKKHLGVVESELSRLKGLQTSEPGVADKKDTARDSKVDEKDMQAQDAKIQRVPQWEWRDVKNERAIKPRMPTLIVSSNGHGRAGRRSNGRRSTKQNDATDSGDSNLREDASFDSAYRLAINSRILLNLLGDFLGMNFPEDRNVWVRPFKYLVAYETEIREALQDTEATFDQAEARPKSSDLLSSTQNSNGVNTSGTKSMQERRAENANAAELAPQVSATDESRAKAERDQLRCLVNFMDTDMKDIFDVKRQVINQTLKEVAFENLWLLYRPGDLVYSTESPEESSEYQAYRVLHVTGGRPVLDTVNESGFRPVEDRSWDEESENEEKACDTIRGSPSNVTPFIIDCFSIDFDGSRLGPKSKRFVISTYSGKRKVDALEVHSEVMLDQAAAVAHYRKAVEKWRLKIGGGVISVPTVADSREVFDPLPVKRDEDLSSDVFDDSIIDRDRRNDFVNSTTLLKSRDIFDPSLSDDYVMLLPFRIYGYAMLNRKWFPLNINLISDITPDQVRTSAAGYEDLVLPEGHKKLLQAIVKNQVRDAKQISGGRGEDPDDFQMDVVKGKGKGLIILLHGAPGVGKTSTAECVAAQLKRPLLPITCGDISTSVKQAEETLQEYCALAYRWKCVLLLDEADVFLAKREKGDITRNGLVSVFLRVLEYFSGVIILTTNRVGEFDEAFRSRIHVSLYYPKLDQDATLQVWERSLSRLRHSGLQLDFSEDEIRKFAQDHWLENEHRPSRHWNGRQIKNAFQTAMALANWEFYEMKQGRTLERPLLKPKHFDRVARTSAHFDDYISDIHNISDDTFSVLAARDELRKDTHPAMSHGRSQTQDFVPRSKRTTPARRGAGTRDARTDASKKAEGGSDNKVRELELELELMKLKQASGKEEVQAQAGDDEDEEW